MRIRRGGILDRAVRHATSEWGWPGAVLLVVGLLAFLVGPSMQWLDYRGVSDQVEQATALGVAVVGLVWTLAAAWCRPRQRSRRPFTGR